METLTIEVLNRYIPGKILQTSTQMNNDFPLLANKKITEEPLIYRCLHTVVTNQYIPQMGYWVY